jgi:hypothetical protein
MIKEKDSSITVGFLANNSDNDSEKRRGLIAVLPMDFVRKDSPLFDEKAFAALFEGMDPAYDYSENVLINPPTVSKSDLIAGALGLIYRTERESYITEERLVEYIDTVKNVYKEYTGKDLTVTDFDEDFKSYFSFVTMSDDLNVEKEDTYRSRYALFINPELAYDMKDLFINKNKLSAKLVEVLNSKEISEVLEISAGREYYLIKSNNKKPSKK